MQFKLRIILIVVFLIAGCALELKAQSKTGARPARKTSGLMPDKKTRSQLKFINPKTMPPAAGYTHVVEAAAGRTIYLSGQIPVDSAGKLIGAGDFRAQCTQVFENLKAGLEAAGANFNDVAKLNIYVTDISQIAIFREVRDKYVNTKNPPASSLVEVRRLVREEFMIEIDATAVAP